jgi:hypothetical protein
VRELVASIVVFLPFVRPGRLRNDGALDAHLFGTDDVVSVNVRFVSDRFTSRAR